MTCKDCIYEPKCLTHISYGMGKDWNNRYTPDIEIRCKDFKNKADFVEVKHGEWHLLYDCANQGVYCSVCNKKVYKTNYANQKIKSPFCPNCGARMDLKEGGAGG